MGASLPDICSLFIPKLLAMKANGSLKSRISTSYDLNHLGLNEVEGNRTYEYDGVYGEHHDRTALSNSLVGLLNRLPGLYYTGLLLLEIQKVIYLQGRNSMQAVMSRQACLQPFQVWKCPVSSQMSVILTPADVLSALFRRPLSSSIRLSTSQSSSSTLNTNQS